MSTDATVWAWKEKGIKSSDKIVLLSLADRANEAHVCFPSITRLAADTCLNRKTIIECLLRLENSGLIRSKKRGGSVNVYTLIGVQNRHETSGKTSPEIGTSPKIGTSPEIGTAPVPKTGLTPVPILGHEPKREPIKNLKGFSGGKPTAKPENVSDEVWQDFTILRKAKKSPITNTVITMLKKQAEKAGITLEHALSICCERGWQSFNANWDWKGDRNNQGGTQQAATYAPQAFEPAKEVGFA
ncbi:MAG: helix-turn-helix domain-containing protein [Mariprofundaceae bacterium]|nr:helix-turn-helix domain-containing protein [Mariprofundaceae bacterium]